MVAAEVHGDAKIDTRGADQGSFLAGLDNAFFNRRDVLFGDDAAHDGIDKFKTGPAGQGLHDNPAVAELPMPARLFFVLTLDAGLIFDGFAVGDFGGFEQNLDIEFSFQFFDGAFNVDLTQSRQQDLLGFGIALQAQCRVLFQQLGQGDIDFILITGCFGFQGE